MPATLAGTIPMRRGEAMNLDCGLGLLDLLPECLAAYAEAFTGLFPNTTPPYLGAESHQGWVSAMRWLLGQGEGVQGMNYPTLAKQFYAHFCRVREVVPGDPLPEVAIPYEAAVRHLVRFMDAEPDDVQTIKDGAVEWREWAAQRLRKVSEEFKPPRRNDP